MDMDNLIKAFPSLKTESLLKISKAISKAGERDFYNFDIKCPKVLKECELQSIEKFFNGNPVKMLDVDESILSALGDGFEKELNSAKSDTRETRLKELKESYGLSDDELLVYASFLRSIGKKEYLSKTLIPLITRTPTDFLKTKDYIIRLLSTLRKLPQIEERTYVVQTKSKERDFFKVGETFILPSFVIGNKIDNFNESYPILSLRTISDFDFDKEERGKVDFSEYFDDLVEDYLGEGYQNDYSNSYFDPFYCDYFGDKEKKEEEYTVFIIIDGKTRKGRVLEGYEEKGSGKKFVIFEPDASFKVTKIEKKDTYYIVYGEFVEDRNPILENVVEKYAKSSTENPVPPSGPKYTERFPASLSDILKPESDYKAKTLKDAIENAGIEDIDDVIKKAFAKKKERESILKDFNLTKEDVMSIFIYTLQNKGDGEKSVYRVLNNALANRTKENLLPLREYIFYLLMGLRDLPRFIAKSNLFRGVRMSRKELDATYCKGRTLVWTTFTSTTTDEKAARKFASDVKNKEEKHDPDECSVLFEIYGKFRGYSIGTFSRYRKEEEVLLEPDTKFTVMLISQEEGTGITRVVLAVKETEPILKKEMDTFKAAYEKIEWDIDENYEKEVSERMIERMKAQVTQFPLASSGSIGSFSQGGIGQELSFSSSSPMNIGNIEPTGNIQERSSISILETSRGNLNAGEGEQVNMPTIFQ